MTEEQFSTIMAMLRSIYDLLRAAPTLQTGIVLLMFAIGWSSAG